MFSNDQKKSQNLSSITERMSEYSINLLEKHNIDNPGNINSANSFVGITYSLDILNQILEKKVSKNPDEFEGQHSTIETFYENIIVKCTDYLKAHESPQFWKVRKARKALIEELLSQVRQDFSKILSMEIDSLEINDENTTWKDVLSDIRTEEINITGRDDLGYTGEAMSNVLTIGRNDNMRFFKDEERLTPVATYMNKYIDENVPENMRKECEKVVKLLINKKKIKDLPEFLDNTDENLEVNKTKLIDSLNNLGYSTDLTNEKITLFIDLLTNLAKKDLLNLGAEKAQIDKGSIISNRNIATSRLASLLGVENIIAKSNNAKIIEQGKEARKGNIMDKAIGTNFKTIDSDKQQKTISGEGQRQLVCLQILDTLSAQIDRHLNNYFYQTSQKDDKIHIDGVQGIDNDLSFGKITDLDKKVNRLNKFVDKSTGQTTLDYIDNDLANRILNISPELLRYTFLDLLSDSEIKALVTRLKIMQDAIQTSIKLKGTDFLKNPEEWGDETLTRLFYKKNYLRPLCRRFDIDMFDIE